MINVRQDVSDFKTKYKEGFLFDEIKELLEKYPSISTDRFFEAIEEAPNKVVNGWFLICHRDVEKALHCGINKSGLAFSEFN